MPNFSFYGGRKQSNEFFILFLNFLEYGTQEINSSEIRLDLIFSANMNKRDKLWKKTRIHFKSDVFAALAIVILRGGPW